MNRPGKLGILGLGLILAVLAAACGSSGGHPAVVSHSTSAAPSSSPTPSPSPSKAWWVLSNNRVFHGTEVAAEDTCTHCNLAPSGPYSTKALAKKQAAKDKRQARAALAAKRRAKIRAHRHWLHVTVAYRTDRIVFAVSGTGYPSIQYGSDSNTADVPGGNGPLGDGVALPFSASQRDNQNALYFAVTAQLEGGGDISDSVAEVQTTVYKDGHSVVHSHNLARAHASGGYAIANAQYNNSGF